MCPPVAKLDIAADSDSEGRGFESLRADQYNKISCLLFLASNFFFFKAKIIKSLSSKWLF